MMIYPSLNCTAPAADRLINNYIRWRLLSLSLALIGTFTANVSGAAELDGFMEPYRVIDIAATDVATIAEVLVEKGAVVKSGQALVRLETKVLRAALDAADQRRKMRGRETAAQASVRLSRSHLDKLRPLLSSGHAQADEIAKAEADLDIAEANLLAVREERQVSDREYTRIAVEIERRTIRSPIDATVILLTKEVGEAVIPADPELLTIVQLNPLKIALRVPAPEVQLFSLEQIVVAICDGLESKLATTVRYIAPVTDPETGTVLVELIVDNADSKYRSGVHCTVQI